MAENIIEQLKEKQEQIQDMQRREERRAGREDQLMKSLQTDFGVCSIAAAEDEMKSLAAQNAKDETKLDQLDKEMGEIITKAEGEE